MNNNKSESQELLRLFKCAVDTGTEVLSAFAGSKLLPTYNGCFIRFLDDKKHQIFHLWQSKKLLCCACPAAGCNLKRTGHMDKWIFKKLYDDNGNEDRGHIVRNSGRVEQLCLHKYITRNIAIHELDISAISFLLRSLAPLSQNETTALDTVTTYRSQICHAHSMKCYSITELNTVWNELENALVDLADPFYKRIVRNQIKDLRKVNFEKEEITDLLKKVAEVNTGIIEVKNSMSSNINAITRSEGNLKTMVTEESLVMKQAQQVILQEVISSKSIVKESGANMLEQFGVLNTNQAEMRGQLKEIVKMVHQITNTTISLKYEQSIDLSEGEECLVLWQLATPANWNPKEIEQILNESQERFKDLPMKIKFVRNGSLVLMTTIAAKDLKESTTFQTAVKAFLTRMVEVCNIDTTIKCNVDVTLHILKSDEVNVSCIVPNITTDDKAVQTEVPVNMTCKLPNITTDDKLVQTDDESVQTDDECVQIYDNCLKTRQGIEFNPEMPVLTGSYSNENESELTESYMDISDVSLCNPYRKEKEHSRIESWAIENKHPLTFSSTLEEKLIESKLDRIKHYDYGETMERDINTYTSLGKGYSRQTGGNADDIEKQKRANKNDYAIAIESQEGAYTSLVEDTVGEQNWFFQDRPIAEEDNGDDIERQKMANKSIKKDDDGDNIDRQIRENKSMDKCFPKQSESRCTIL